MTTQANTIRLDFKNNPELRDALSSKKVGDECSLEIKFQVDSNSEEGIEGSVISVAPEGYKAPPGKEKEIEPAPNEPVMIAVVGKNGKGMMGKGEMPEESMMEDEED